MKYLYLSGAVVFFALGSGVLVFGMPGSDALGSDDEIEIEEQGTIPASTGEAVGAPSAVVQASPTPTQATQTTQTIATTKCYGDVDPDEDDWEGDDEDDKQNCVTEYTTVPVATSGSTGATGTGSAAPSAAPAPTPTPPTGGGNAPATSGYTLATVAQHNTVASCWSVVDGKVYNLTNWISQHPGGQVEIKAMCGIDATSAFQGQHAGARKPAQELAAFYLGNLTQ